MPFVHRWSTLLATDARLTATDIAVARAVALHMSAAGDSCWPTHTRVAFEAHLAEGTVRRSIQRLRSYGWLEKASGSAPGRAAAYVARLTDIEEEHRRVFVKPRAQRAHEHSDHRTEARAARAQHCADERATPRPGARPGSQEVSKAAAIQSTSTKLRVARIIAGHRQLEAQGRVGGDGLAFVIGRDDLSDALLALANEHPDWHGEKLGNAVELSVERMCQACPQRACSNCPAPRPLWNGVVSLAPRLIEEAFELS